MRCLRTIAPLMLLAVSCTAGGSHADVAAPDLDPDSFTILWTGDTLLADGVLPLLDEHGYDWPFENLDGVLAADYTLVNLEGPITTDTTPIDPSRRWSYNADPVAAVALARIGVDGASLANNHGLDRGPAGVADTIGHLDAAGIEGFGAGSEDAAMTALLIETPHGVVGVVGFGEQYGDDRMATGSRVGTVAATPAAIGRGHDRAVAAGADWVVAFVHWGPNYESVTDGQQHTARQIVAAGYDMVIGHGAHLVRPAEIIDGVPVFYSLGNFVFGTAGRYRDDAPGHSIIVTTPVDADGFGLAVVRCLLTDNDEVDFQPRLCPVGEAADVAAAVHPDVRVDGGVGILRW